MSIWPLCRNSVEVEQTRGFEQIETGTESALPHSSEELLFAPGTERQDPARLRGAAEEAVGGNGRRARTDRQQFHSKGQVEVPRAKLIKELQARGWLQIRQDTGLQGDPRQN